MLKLNPQVLLGILYKLGYIAQSYKVHIVRKVITDQEYIICVYAAYTTICLYTLYKRVIPYFFTLYKLYLWTELTHIIFRLKCRVSFSLLSWYLCSQANTKWRMQPMATRIWLQMEFKNLHISIGISRVAHDLAKKELAKSLVYLAAVVVFLWAALKDSL